MTLNPFVARSNRGEYVALVGSFILVGLEAVIRILTIALPISVLRMFYGVSSWLFNLLAPQSAQRADNKKLDPSTLIRNAADFVDLCAIAGYYVEEHFVQTADGYVLGIHRLAWRKGEESQKVNLGTESLRKNVIYMHHGLLMNSEVWVCLTNEQRCLPFMLVERGYDVWLGNNRGNKYSKKNISLSPNDIPFWNFSMDEFAFHDIPDTIRYVLQITSAASLSYIGFSQGSAQAFATLAVHLKLNEQVNVFIALAPAMSPAGLSNGIVDTLVKASPQVLFLLFGHRSILSSVTMWQSILYPPIFRWIIDTGLSFLFGWHARNMSESQKLAAYPHLYSFTSTKSVVHWFQIIRTKSFQMYDDDQSHFVSLRGLSKSHTKVPKFPTRNIKTPIFLIYGGSDSIVDIKAMLKELPQHTIAIEIPHYEHLDFLWAKDVDTLVFPHVFDALENFGGSQYQNKIYEGRITRQTLGTSSERPSLTDIASDNESTLPGTNSSDYFSNRLDPEPVGTPGAILGSGSQSSIPRLNSSTQKRLGNQFNYFNLNEELNFPSTPKLTAESKMQTDQMEFMTPSGPADDGTSSTGSHQSFVSKNASTAVATASEKSISFSGFLKESGTKCRATECSKNRKPKIQKKKTKESSHGTSK